MTSCIVPGSAPATSALPCIPPEIDLGSGSGYQLQDECAPECRAPELADEQGYGYEQQRTCVAADSAAAAQATRCEPEPLEGAPEPGDGYYIVDSETMEGICHPACVYPEDADDGGWGYEGGRSCVAPGSTAALQALPCIPDDGVCPVVLDCPSVDNQAPVDCGCVEMAGLGARKAEIVDQMTAQSGHAMFLASAMMETDNLQADYPLGDNKTGDAFNAGLTKQNWGMIRSCHAAWNGLGSGDYMTCTAMNDDLALDVQVYTECRNQYGSDWYGGHRAGQPGSTSQDVRLFQNATEWTQQMLSDGHMDDDAYFWADITPI
jgi:hypothetical protein